MKKDKKDIKIFLQHILESVNYIEEDTRDISEEDFLSTRTKQDLVVRRLAVIGEAARNIPADFREKHKDIPWRNMTGMRDVVIHDYFALDLGKIWGTVKEDLPKVKRGIGKLLK